MYNRNTVINKIFRIFSQTHEIYVTFYGNFVKCINQFDSTERFKGTALFVGKNKYRSKLV